MKNMIHVAEVAFVSTLVMLCLTGCPDKCECEGSESACTQHTLNATVCGPSDAYADCTGCLDVHSTQNSTFKKCVDKDDHSQPCPQGEECPKPCICQCNPIKWVSANKCADAGGSSPCNATPCGEWTSVSIATESGC